MQRIMKVTIRLLEKLEQVPERFVTEYTFDNKQHILKTVYPLKEPFSPDTLNEIFPSSKLVTEKGLIFPSLEKSVRSVAFEWSPTGENWYKIHGRNLAYDATIILPEVEKKKRFMTIMELILLGQPQSVECTYSTQEKKLIILV